MTKAYYNEIDLFCAEWLKNLMIAGMIAPGSRPRGTYSRLRERHRRDARGGVHQSHDGGCTVTSIPSKDVAEFEAWWEAKCRAEFVAAYGPNENFRPNWGGGFEKEARAAWMAARSSVETSARPTREAMLETALGQWLHDFGSTNELSQRTRILLKLPHPTQVETSPEPTGGLTIEETRFLAALAGVKPPKDSPGGMTQYGRSLIERVWTEYERLKASDRSVLKSGTERA